jgi:elongation factor G
MKAIYFRGESGDDLEITQIPAELISEANEYREVMLDAVSMFSDELTEALLDEKVTPELIHDAVRTATIGLKITPVFVGSAYKNVGVQPLMDAVIRYLPNPQDITNEAIDLSGETEESIALESNSEKPVVLLAFKLEDSRYGQLTYLRIYQGTIDRNSIIINSRSGKKQKVGRLVRMHSNDMEDIDDASAGDIVAVFGLDCHSGDTFTDGNINVSMTSMFVPNPVISLSIKPIDAKSETNLSKALQRFTKEDPTFQVYVDKDSNETVIRGMGELQLDVYIERMKREYSAEVETSAPQVSYRETISRHADFNYTHKKQTGGSGQYGRVAGFIEPCEDQDFEFVDKIKGGVIPRQFIPAVEKGFEAQLPKGRLIGAPVTNISVTINDGNSHAVDSSEKAFQEAARGAWLEAYEKASPKILEPIMRVTVESPAEFSGNILATLNQRRGMIIGSHEDGGIATVEADVPLADMFGYATVIRSSTQGKAEFNMEFSKYLQVPKSISEELIEKARKEAVEKK